MVPCAEVVILGGGCAGLLAALRLREAGYSVQLVDDFGRRFASLRNLGWLQSGVLEVSLPASDPSGTSVEVKCTVGFSEILARYATHVDQGGFHYLFKSVEDRDRFVDRCHTHPRLGARWRSSVSPCSIHDVGLTPNQLQGTSFGAAAQVPDRLVSVAGVLNALLRECVAAGVHLVPISLSPDVRLTPTDGEWHLTRNNQVEAAGRIAVVALGTGRAKFLNASGLPVAPRSVLTLRVLAIEGRLVDHALASPVYGAPNLLPVCGGGAPRTLVYRTGSPLVPEVLDPTTYRPNRDDVETVVGALDNFLPNLVDRRRSARLFVCQRFQRPHAPSVETVPEHPSLLLLYPGYFTCAPVAARRCVAAITEMLRPANSTSAPTSGPTVRPVTHEADAGDEWELVPNVYGIEVQP